VSSLARRTRERSHLTGEFRLRSGQVSREYFDKYRFESDPVMLHEVAGELLLSCAALRERAPTSARSSA